MIPYGRQDITEDDIDMVIAVLRSEFLTQGPAVPAFEQAVTAKVGASYGVATNSATSALHVAVAALGLDRGDVLWTSPITFVASANCARFCGAEVDFVDIDPKTYTMCPAALAAKLEVAETHGKLPKVIMPVHLCGQPAAMREIEQLARPRGIKIVEDASHAIGASYGGESVGSCQHSDVAVFSFHPVKIVTTAEGGMAVTNDRAVADQMALFRSHGITRDVSAMKNEPDGPWYYEQLQLGWNYRLTDIQAALGMSQLKRLESYIERRNSLADRYDHLLNDLPLILPPRVGGTRSAFHLYVVRLTDRRAAHRQIFEGLRADGIGVNLHYIPVHLQPYYRQLGFKRGDFPNAERYYGEAISLPMYPGLSELDQDRVVRAMRARIST